jgi:hypothetical protein
MLVRKFRLSIMERLVRLFRCPVTAVLLLLSSLIFHISSSSRQSVFVRSYDTSPPQVAPNRRYISIPKSASTEVLRRAFAMEQGLELPAASDQPSPAGTTAVASSPLSVAPVAPLYPLPIPPTQASSAPTLASPAPSSPTQASSSASSASLIAGHRKGTVSPLRGQAAAPSASMPALHGRVARYGD